jgi:excisionase family DNA binding protein
MLLTIADTQRELRCSESAIYRLIRANRLTVVHLGRSVRITKDSVSNLVDELCAVEHAKAPDSQNTRELAPAI